MPKVDFWAIWEPEFFFQNIFLPIFGTGITKIPIKIHLDVNPGEGI